MDATPGRPEYDIAGEVVHLYGDILRFDRGPDRARQLTSVAETGPAAVRPRSWVMRLLRRMTWMPVTAQQEHSAARRQSRARYQARSPRIEMHSWAHTERTFVGTRDRRPDQESQ
jgi:hypothetical protein